MVMVFVRYELPRLYFILIVKSINVSVSLTNSRQSKDRYAFELVQNSFCCGAIISRNC